MEVLVGKIILRQSEYIKWIYYEYFWNQDAARVEHDLYFDQGELPWV